MQPTAKAPAPAPPLALTPLAPVGAEPGTPTSKFGVVTTPTRAPAGTEATGTSVPFTPGPVAMTEYFSPIGKQIIDNGERKKLQGAGKILIQRADDIMAIEKEIKDIDERKGFLEDKRNELRDEVATLSLQIEQVATRLRTKQARYETLKRAYEHQEVQEAAPHQCLRLSVK